MDIKDETTLTMKFKSFTDNTKNIFEDLIKYLVEDITDEHLEFIKNQMKVQITSSKLIEFSKYTFNLYSKFLKGGNETNEDIEQLIEIIDEIELEDLQEEYEQQILNNTEKILFKIAGNINEELVKSLHQYLKETIKIEPKDTILLQQPKLTAEESPYIINYYQKSEMIDEADNSILVTYEFEKKYHDVLLMFTKCLIGPSMKILRFENSNAYTPNIFIERNIFVILEQGRYKEVFEMEDDINDFLYKALNLEIECDGYTDIFNSFINAQKQKIEKTPENLFDIFIDTENLKSFSQDEFIEIPKSFKELIDIVKPIFTQPKRITILVTRPEISDDDLKDISKQKRKC